MLADQRWSRLASSVALADSFIRAARAAASVRDLMELMDAVKGELGFRHYALIHHADLRGAPPGKVDIRDYPDIIVSRIIGEARYRRDPVLRACNFADGAFLWSELGKLVRLERRDRDCLEEGMKAGLNEGITVPCALLGDCLGSCTFSGMKRPGHAARLLGPVQMIGIFAFQAARRLVAAARSPVPQPRLHPRPRDCVVLAGHGRSNKEIARALSITPRTVDGYMTEAREILDAHDRTELVVKAVFAGEIDLAELANRQPE